MPFPAIASGIDNCLYTLYKNSYVQQVDYAALVTDFIKAGQSL